MGRIGDLMRQRSAASCEAVHINFEFFLGRIVESAHVRQLLSVSERCHTTIITALAKAAEKANFNFTRYRIVLSMTPTLARAEVVWAVLTTGEFYRPAAV
jgi:hypothetical protein